MSRLRRPTILRHGKLATIIALKIKKQTQPAAQTMLPTFQQIRAREFQHFRLGWLSLPRRRSIHFSDRVELAAGRFGASEWVLSRALCRYNHFDLSRLPAAKRKAALALQLPQWSPYSDGQYAIIWQEGFASVWCWDNSRIDAEIVKHGKMVKSQEKIPECLLRAPLQTGLRLLKCLDGIEGQLWQDARLVASRWWPQSPNQQEWLSFQRDCGISAEQQEAQKSTATVQVLPLLAEPWARIASQAGSTDDMPAIEMALYALMLLALGLATVIMGLQHYQTERAIAARVDELATIKHKAASIFAARETALNAVARLKSIAAIEPYPEQLVLMVAVAEALPTGEAGGGAYVREWDMTGNRLKISVGAIDANVPGATYVQALEKTGLFANIQIVTSSDPKTMGLSMEVLPREFVNKKTDEHSL
jgi:hypothetical protein